MNREESCIQWFISELNKIALNLHNTKTKQIDPLTSTEIIDYEKASLCHICEKPFLPNDLKVKDHFHLANGANDINNLKTNYRGPAHNSCNLNFKKINTIPVFFHNLSSYDSHFLIKELLNNFSGDLTVLPATKEKYISFTKFVDGTNIKLRFVDSYRFMPESLDTLASQLDNEQKKITRLHCANELEFSLLCRKGVFPFEYLDSWEKLNDNALPEKKCFYSSLNESEISDLEYINAHNVWTTFKCENLGTYSDLYLKTDVLLLADIYENFRKTSIQTYKLDPANFVSSPSFSFQAMLKTIEYKLELITDIDQIMMIENGIRGGVAQCCNRYAKANNKFMENYDSSKQEKYLLLLDQNNMYGFSMSRYLPYAGFEWVENPSTFNLQNLPSINSPIGYILEVDLTYPENLHEIHRDMPFCPEHLTPPNSKSKQKKLLTTLYNKKDEIRYELSGKTIDRVRNPGVTTTLKGYTSFNKNNVNRLKNAGWNIDADCLVDVNNPATGEFNLCVPLNTILGFAEDFKKIIINLRQELVLIRSNSDHNAIYNSVANEINKIKINKMMWKMPHISVADDEKLKLLQHLESGNELQIAFRSWELVEYPLLQKTKSHTWNVKSTTQLEKPRYVIVGFQTDRKNSFNKNNGKFDNCNLKQIKIMLNGELYPYDTISIDYDKNQYSILYEMYLNFQHSYYERDNEPLFNPSEFKSIAPLAVIDCSRQNDVLNYGVIEVRIEFECTKDMADNTSAYCLILHDRVGSLQGFYLFEHKHVHKRSLQADDFYHQSLITEPQVSIFIVIARYTSMVVLVFLMGSEKITCGFM
ncbi:unnamed protein product [Brassicogethes aeneus]|uniref:Double jelly roll-like domain-containing protein n=1 Tax=Brassicogethes aeneus TaxID=1431903 RepID=A0A9P0B237_BRAAE|nr:unnamed protein product [Brassicogethes aeneus]